MNYSRFSSECDIYSYQQDPGFFVVHVASLVVPMPSDEQADGMSAADILDFTRRHAHRIGGRFDGKVFVEETPHGAFCRVRDMASIGYRVPWSVWANFHRAHPELGLGVLATPRAAARPPGR